MLGESISRVDASDRSERAAMSATPQTTAWHLIEIAFDDLDERDRAFDAIEKLLGEMGQIGTLSARTEYVTEEEIPSLPPPKPPG